MNDAAMDENTEDQSSSPRRHWETQALRNNDYYRGIDDLKERIDRLEERHDQELRDVKRKHETLRDRYEREARTRGVIIGVAVTVGTAIGAVIGWAISMFRGASK